MNWCVEIVLRLAEAIVARSSSNVDEPTSECASEQIRVSRDRFAQAIRVPPYQNKKAKSEMIKDSLTLLEISKYDSSAWADGPLEIAMPARVNMTILWYENAALVRLSEPCDKRSLWQRNVPA